ncbi:MAG TPA: hypothetical protein VF221_14405 [Chloroflexota bacterium]
MSDIVVIVAEIIIGLALLTVVGAAVGVVVNRMTVKRPPIEMLQERYIRGELTRDQYVQMRQDLAATRTFGEGLRAPQPNGREAEVAFGSEKTK